MEIERSQAFSVTLVCIQEGRDHEINRGLWEIWPCLEGT